MMRQTIVLSYDSRWCDYIVKKLVNRLEPQVGSRLTPTAIKELLAEAKTGRGLNVEIYGDKP